jgi:hypothetical protein
VPAQQALLRALEKDTDANILSAPTVLTSDNQGAEIVSGENVPFIASRSTDTANLANTFATIERRDVGITLRITPQISEGGSVRLDIFQEVSAVIGNDPQLGPTTTIRSATTTVITKDGQTAVIGGLISDSATKTESAVPYISQIPVIGNFFKFTAVHNMKNNLLLFLTPHIVRNERDQRDIAVGERERIILKQYQEHGKRGPNWPQLYSESWEVRPSLEEKPKPSATPEREAGKPRREEALAEAPAERKRVATSADYYVLLATVADAGSAPPNLTGANGLVSLAVPVNSPLASLFKKGSGYRFESDDYTASYICLEVFATPQQAFEEYPEGMRVSPRPVTFLHWQEPSDPATVNPRHWAEVY